AYTVGESAGPPPPAALRPATPRLRSRRSRRRFSPRPAHAAPPLRVRELDTALELILRGGRQVERRQEATAGAIISIDCDGNFSTFSPELLGLPSARYGGFALGNVARDDFRAAAQTPRFRAMAAHAAAGGQQCRA